PRLLREGTLELSDAAAPRMRERSRCSFRMAPLEEALQRWLRGFSLREFLMIGRRHDFRCARTFLQKLDHCTLVDIPIFGLRDLHFEDHQARIIRPFREPSLRTAAP